MSSLHANWNDKIHAFSISELGVAGNLSMGDFFQATDESFGHLELIRNLTIDENTVILAVIGEDKQLKLLHHPTDFGGKLTRKENKVVALEGLSTKAIIGLLDANKLTATQAKQAPDAEKLMECTAKEGLTIILFCIDLCSVLICLTSPCCSGNEFDSNLNHINEFIALKVII